MGTLEISVACHCERKCSGPACSILNRYVQDVYYALKEQGPSGVRSASPYRRMKPLLPIPDLESYCEESISPPMVPSTSPRLNGRRRPRHPKQLKPRAYQHKKTHRPRLWQLRNRVNPFLRPRLALQNIHIEEENAYDTRPMQKFLSLSMHPLASPLYPQPCRPHLFVDSSQPVFLSRNHASPS